MPARSRPGDHRGSPGGGGSGGALRAVLDRRARWIEVFVVLATLVAGFVLLDFLAAYFRDYSHLGLIFFFAWILASLIAPVADYLQHRLRRLPRPAAVLGVVIPVILVGALIGARVVTALADSVASLAAALPSLIANPPSIVTDTQAWLAARGIATDLDSTYKTVASSVLASLGGVAVGASGVLGWFADALTVITLAIFIAIDRERILQFGVDLMPPERRADQVLFRKSIGAAFSGFMRSQVLTGAAYGLWALVVSFVFGVPFGIATAFAAGLLQSIPIYGPYVSWLPPVLVAVLTGSPSVVPVVIAMLVGWFVNMNILAPLVRSDQLQVNPVVVTFAFLLGAQLAGPLGAIVAIPLAAVAQAFFLAYRDRARGASTVVAVEDTEPPARAQRAEP